MKVEKKPKRQSWLAKSLWIQHVLIKRVTKIPVDANIVVKGNTLPYVSRGGLKLEKAIQTYPIDLQDAVMVDIGASTGGFTDCAPTKWCI